MRLDLADVQVQLGGTTVVSGADILVATGEIAALVGPNGSGKSSLLRTVYRHVRPVSGTVHVDGHDVWTMSPGASARRIAAVPQETRVEFDVTAADIVAMGRTPHKRLFTLDADDDRASVEEALERVGLTGLANRRFATLSGGERQRVLVARALAQRAPVLILDEPTNHLDAQHQFAILELVRQLGVTALLAIHDLNLAAAYCDRVHVLDNGRVRASGPPAKVFTPALLREVFKVTADVLTHPRTGRPHLVFSP